MQLSLVLSPGVVLGRVHLGIDHAGTEVVDQPDRRREPQVGALVREEGFVAGEVSEARWA